MTTATPSTHAIVIGGSMAGMLAARVLSDHFDRVTLIERDRYPETPEFRSGVPQARHIHVLLVRGMRILERLFPGLDSELDAAGATPVQFGTPSVEYRTPIGWAPRFDSSLVTRCSSRILLDWCVHERVAHNPKVTILENHEVNRLLLDDSHTRVIGVQAQGRHGTREEQTLYADLVVDASGRSSSTPKWLADLGYPAPEETLVNSFVGYATRWYNVPANFSHPWKVVIIQGIPHVNPRGAGIFMVEGNRMLVTVTGVNKDYPPTDDAGFLEFARSLPDPLVYDAIKDAEPISPVYGYQRTTNRWLHYEHLDRMPANFVVVGDAVCGFNPVYGQGMSVSAMGAEALDAWLTTAQGTFDGRTFQKKLATINETPWLLATGEDFRYPGTEGKRPGLSIRIAHWYTDQLTLLMAEHGDIVNAFTQVTNLLQPPSSLMRPSIAWRVFKQALHGRSLAHVKAAAPPQMQSVPR